MNLEIKNLASAYFQVKPEAVIVLNRLLGGMSNYTYKIMVKNEFYTIRIIGEYAEKFVERKAEFENLKIAESLGLTNQTIYFNTETGVKISRFIEGENITEETVDLELERVSKALKILHQSNFKAHQDFLPDQKLINFSKLAKKLDPKFLKLKDWWLKTYYQKYQNMPKVFCHGDCQRSNFVIGKDQLYLLDYEFSGNMDPLYDIANFGHNDYQDALKLLPIYLGRKPTQEELYRLRFYRMQQMLQWYPVARFKAEHGMSVTLKIPFDEISKHYLKKAYEHYLILKD